MFLSKKLPLFVLIITALGTPNLEGTITHNSTKTFTFTPTSLPVNGSILSNRCIDIVESMKDTHFSPAYVHITDHDNLWHFQRGIQLSNKETTTVLYSRGYRSSLGLGTFIFTELNYGQAFRTIYKYIKLGAIQCPTIGFDYVDTVDNFDYACGLRAERLEFMFHQVQKKSNNIILFGDCIGSKTILHFASTNPLQNVKALVLEAPVYDMKSMVTNEAQHDFWWLHNSKEGLYNALRAILPQYNVEDDISHEKLANIPKDIPIFFAHLHNDKLMDNETAKQQVNALRDSGHTVYFIVIDNPEVQHSRIGGTQPFIKAVNAFYKKYDLPHDIPLAQDGQELLERALHNTTNNTIEHIESL